LTFRMIVTLIIASISLISTTDAAQTVAVRGMLLCGNETLNDVEIKLFDNHRFLQPDSLLATVKSDERGRFTITGSVDDDDMKPDVRIYHRCNNKGLFGIPNLCKREAVYTIPSSYISSGTRSNNWFELGTINMDMKQANENTHCFSNPLRSILDGRK
ncbi:hypothetical protein PMAYCL1PPCAC_33037, partial [Pristionchus mayeri]